MRTTRSIPAARITGVDKRFGPVQALHGLDLDIPKGEILALLGPNGAGKTTAVRLLLGLDRPDAGEIQVLGHPPGSAASRQGTGAMLQISGLAGTLTVREHLTLHRTYYEHPLPVADLARVAGLGGFLDRRYGKLSGGQQRRVQFALALVGDPSLIFLDEPTTGLDVGARRVLWQEIRRLAEEGRTVLLTTHYLEEADALADRIVVLDHGRIIAQGTPAEIKSRAAGRKIRCITRIPRERVSAVAAVTDVRADGEALEILTSDVEGVLRVLLSEDPGLCELTVAGAALEDAFLALTDRTEEHQEDAA